MSGQRKTRVGHRERESRARPIEIRHTRTHSIHKNLHSANNYENCEILSAIEYHSSENHPCMRLPTHITRQLTAQGSAGPNGATGTFHLNILTIIHALLPIREPCAPPPSPQCDPPAYATPKYVLRRLRTAPLPHPPRVRIHCAARPPPAAPPDETRKQIPPSGIHTPFTVVHLRSIIHPSIHHQRLLASAA